MRINVVLCDRCNQTVKIFDVFLVYHERCNEAASCCVDLCKPCVQILKDTQGVQLSETHGSIVCKEDIFKKENEQ